MKVLSLGHWSVWSADPLLAQEGWRNQDSVSFPLREGRRVQMGNGSAARSGLISSGRIAVKLWRGFSLGQYIYSDAFVFPGCSLVWLQLSKSRVNVPLLLKSVLLVSAQKREEGDLSPPTLAQGEDRSVLWVRWGDGSEVRTGELRGNEQKESGGGGRSVSQKPVMTHRLPQGIPPPALPTGLFQSPPKEGIAPEGQKWRFPNLHFLE